MRDIRPSVVSLVFVIVSAGCTQQLELHYVSYPDPTAAGSQPDSKSIMSSALKGEQIFPIARTNIFIVPTASLSGTKTNGNNNSLTQQNQTDKPAAAAPPNNSTNNATVSPSASNQANKNGTAASAAKGTNKPPSAKAAAPQPTQQGQGNDNQTQQAGNLGNGQSPQTSATATNPMTTATIDSVSWSAVPVPVADSAAYLSVSGTNDLFHTDTLSIGHPDNSDVVSTINSKAVNNAATVIASAASVVAAILPLAGVAAAVPKPDDKQQAAAAASAAQLRPTWIRVPDQPVTIPTEIEREQYWYYTLTWNNPAGAVSLDEFLSSVKDQAVSVFPVPACVSATMNLYHAAGKDDPVAADAPTATFFVTVETPNFVRPYLLPGTGAVTLGSVCGASGTDSTPSVSGHYTRHH